MANRLFINDLGCDDGTLPVSNTPIAAITSTNYSVTSTSSGVVAANANRRYLRIQNLGSARVYLNCTSGTAALNHGIRLNASNTDSSVFELNSDQRYTGAVKGVAATSGTKVSVLQG